MKTISAGETTVLGKQVLNIKLWTPIYNSEKMEIKEKVIQSWPLKISPKHTHVQ